MFEGPGECSLSPCITSPISLDTNELLKGAGALPSPERSQIKSRPDSRPSQHCRMREPRNACELRVSGQYPLQANKKVYIGPPMGLHMSYIVLPVTLTYMLSHLMILMQRI